MVGAAPNHQVLLNSQAGVLPCCDCYVLQSVCKQSVCNMPTRRFGHHSRSARGIRTSSTLLALFPPCVSAAAPATCVSDGLRLCGHKIAEKLHCADRTPSAVEPFRLLRLCNTVASLHMLLAVLGMTLSAVKTRSGERTPCARSGTDVAWFSFVTVLADGRLPHFSLSSRPPLWLTCRT
jgi:hypothetical protein